MFLVLNNSFWLIPIDSSQQNQQMAFLCKATKTSVCWWKHQVWGRASRYWKVLWFNKRAKLVLYLLTSWRAQSELNWSQEPSSCCQQRWWSYLIDSTDWLVSWVWEVEDDQQDWQVVEYVHENHLEQGELVQRIINIASSDSPREFLVGLGILLWGVDLAIIVGK